MSNILINKQKLTDYLSDFEPSYRNSILSDIDESIFDHKPYLFIKEINKYLKIPAVGKQTLRYWMSRGWNKLDSENKRIKKKSYPGRSPMSIEFWISRGFNEEEAKIKIKSQRKSNKEYWTSKGHTEEEAVELVSNFQKNNSKKLVEKLNSDVIFRESLEYKRSNNKKYWINLGFSEEESIVKVSERQKTFSLDICIKKWGEELGRKKWKERQDKWINSLKSGKYNLKDGKNSRDIDFFKIKYGDNWLDFYIEQIYKGKESIIKDYIRFKNYKDLIEYLINNNLKFSSICRILELKLIQEIYSNNFKNMYNFLLSIYKFEGRDIEYYKKMNGDSWVDKFINEHSYKDKNEIVFLLSFNNWKDLIDYLLENNTMTQISEKIKSVLLLSYYEVSKSEIFNYISEKDPKISCTYGDIRYFNGHICRSSGEYLISNFLKNNNIDYEYEKIYSGTRRKTDFYLVDKDIYIEYTGMDTRKKHNNYSNKKQELSENFNVFFSNNIEEIKNKISELYDIKNDNESIEKSK